MRTSFRTWAAECSDVPREIAEHALAHVEGSAAELAYRRTDYFERRRVGAVRVLLSGPDWTKSRTFVLGFLLDL